MFLRARKPRSLPLLIYTDDTWPPRVFTLEPCEAALHSQSCDVHRSCRTSDGSSVQGLSLRYCDRHHITALKYGTLATASHLILYLSTSWNKTNAVWNEGPQDAAWTEALRLFFLELQEEQKALNQSWSEYQQLSNVLSLVMLIRYMNKQHIKYYWASRLTIWFIWVTVQHSIARQIYPLLLQDAIHLSPVRRYIQKLWLLYYQTSHNSTNTAHIQLGTQKYLSCM